MSDLDDELGQLSRTPLPSPPSPWPADERTVEHALASGRPLPAEVTVKLAGVSFSPGYPQNLVELTALQAAGSPLQGELCREPDNPHDPNAVAVRWSLRGRGGPLGHLPRAVAGRVAAEMDAGVPWRVASMEVLRDPMYPDRPGVQVRLMRWAGASEG